LVKDKGISLQTKIDLNETEFLIDKDKVMQVVINLLSNAVKFTEPPNGLIVLRVINTGEFLEISVNDNGKGISHEYQQLIFEKFFQARNQTVRKPKGSGLGLAICKKIVELHGGEIKVLSESGKGATFVFTIPKLKA
jgi:signal transduction histidine kinase